MSREATCGAFGASDRQQPDNNPTTTTQRYEMEWLNDCGEYHGEHVQVQGDGSIVREEVIFHLLHEGITMGMVLHCSLTFRPFARYLGKNVNWRPPSSDGLWKKSSS